MQAFYAASFDREWGCTEQEWLAWLPGAIGSHPYQRVAQALTARIEPGQLILSWRVDAPPAIAQVRAPRLVVSFRFTGLDEAQRYQFMKRFDLYMQRGAG